LETDRYKAPLEAALQDVLIAYVEKLPICTRPPEAGTFACKPQDTSSEALAAFIASQIKVQDLTKALPSRIEVPLVLPPLGDIATSWTRIVQTSLLVCVSSFILIILLSRTEWQQFWKRFAGIFTSMAVTFTVLMLGFSELISYSRYILEQKGDSHYANALIDAFVGYTKERLFTVTVSLVLLALFCAGWLFFLKKRAADQARFTAEK